MNGFVKKNLIGIMTLVIVCVTAHASASLNSHNPPVITSTDTLLFENFNGPEGPFATNPLPGWIVIDNGAPEWDETSWSRYENTPYPQYWNGDLARVLFAGTDAIADWLISPSMDCSGESIVSFSYKQRHSNSGSNPDTAFVFGSTDGGQTWPHTVVYYDYSVGALNHPDTAIFDISSWAAGYIDVKIAFCLKGYYVLSWYIDEPTVEGDVSDTLLYEDFNGPWGPFGNNPPAGWTIINEIVPDPPNANDWSRWYYSTWPDTVALAYDNYNSQTADEWLITPVLSFSETAVCSISFYNSYWDDDYDDTDSAFVWGSTDGGNTWEHLIVLYTIYDDRSTFKDQSWRGFDISSWAQGQENVKLGFHYIKDDPSYIGWWFFDDLTVYEVPLGADNVAALSFDYPSEFIVIDQDYNSQVTVQNLSLEPQTIDLNLSVLDANATEVYNETETGIVLDSMEVSQITFSEAFSPATEGNHTFTSVVINPGDEDPSDDTVQVVLYAYEHQGSGGPDAFGYRFIDNTIPGGPEFNWIDICSTGVHVEPGSHYFMSDGISLGFNIDFYGDTYNSIWINSHGELHLGSRDTWLSTNDCPLPDLSTPHAPLLAVFWDRLYIHYEEGQGVYYEYFDQPANDFFIVQWLAKVDGELSDSLSFQAILYEDGDIIYQYNHVNDLPGGRGQEATVGMEYDVIPSGITYLCNDDNPANRLENGLAIRWTTQSEPPPPVFVDMIPDNPPVTVPAGGAFTFTGILENNTGMQINGDVWIMLGLPGGSTYGPLQQFIGIPLAPDQIITIPGVTQSVPGFAPLGTYDYIAYCGLYPSFVIDSASFPFTVVAPEGGNANNWILSGWFYDESQNIPTEFTLSDNYPNPFNASTTISFQIPVECDVKLEIFNIKGQKVASIVNGHALTGNHSVQWDASAYSSGIYFYKLTAGERVITKRMTLLK